MSKVHLCPCTHSFVIYSGWAAQKFRIIWSWSFQSGPSWGWWVGFSSHKFSCHVQHSWHISISAIFLFYKVSRPTPWTFGKIPRAPHFNFCVSSVCRRRLRRCFRTCLHFPRELALRFCPDPFKVIFSDIWIFQLPQPCYTFGRLLVFLSLV